MGLEPHGPDTFVAVGPDYPWGRVYGGQVVAQAMRAAASTVPGPSGQFRVHSLHAYFIRSGDAEEPIRFEVDRLRNVVDGAEQLDVETWDGRPVRIGAARQARATDLAVIDLPARSARRLDPLAIARQPASPGDPLTAIGYAEAGPALITHGQMIDTPSGRRHLGEPGTVVRMSTGLRHGNSGGPVLSDHQEVVGVAYALDLETNLTLAIPMRRLRATLADPAAFEPVQSC